MASGGLPERRRHRRIHAAGESTDNTVLVGTLADLRDRFLYHGTGSPGRFAAADAVEEVANDLFPLRGMCDFGVKLQPHHALCVSHGGDGRAFSTTQPLVTTWKNVYAITVTHPYGYA